VVPGAAAEAEVKDPQTASEVAPQQDPLSSKSPPNLLPPGWERHEDTNGPYYWHIKSGTIQRELPSSDQALGNTSTNPALIIPGTLNSSSVRRSQTISSQMCTSATAGSLISTTLEKNPNSNGSVGGVGSSGNNNPSSSSAEKAEKRKSWSQFLENSEREREQERIRESCLREKERPKSESSLRFVAVSLGSLSISEEDLTPERSSRAVSKVIAELTNPGHGIGAKGISPSGYASFHLYIL
jgi:amyloid beta (A4) precursor protein-binding family B protein 2 (Fe65-like)